MAMKRRRQQRRTGNFATSDRAALADRPCRAVTAAATQPDGNSRERASMTQMRAER
jgi:hypothetical protein